MLAEAACYYKALGKTLVDVLNELYEKHGYYEESQVALTLQGEAGAKRIKEILANLRTSKLSHIGKYQVIKFEDYKEEIVIENGEEKKLEGFANSDVLKYYLEDGSWIAIRPSGTEPKCKFYYCVKGTSLANAHEKGDELKAEMAELTK